MDEWLTKDEIQVKHLHVSEHKMPFECDIVDVIPQKGTNFSDRWKFLKSLFYITSDGYYFQYADVVLREIDENQEGSPFDIYLDGALRCAYSYSFTSSPSITLGFIIGILSKGHIYVNRNKYNNIYFLFVDFGYTYIRDTEGSNATLKTSYIKNIETMSELLRSINYQFEELAKVGNFLFVKKKNQTPQIFETSTLKRLDISFDKIVYGDYSCEYTDSSVLESGYDDYFICKNGKWGCLDGEGKLKIDCRYDRIEHFGNYIEDGYLVSQYNSEGLISGEGEVVIPCQFDKIECLTHKRYNYETLYLARGHRKYSIWDETGECLKNNMDQCCFVNSYSEGDDYESYRHMDVFWMKTNGIGSIVKGGQFDSISDVVYDKYKESINYCGEVFIIVAKSNRYGIIDAKGKVIIDYKFEDLSFIDDKRLLAYKEGKCGVIDFKCIIIPIMYDDIVPVITACGGINSYIGVVDGNKKLLDINGNALFTNYNYDEVYVEDVYDKEEGFKIIGSQVLYEGKWGFVKQDGYPLIPCRYESIEAMVSNNSIIAFKVRLNGLYGVVDVNNRFLIKCQCSELYLFRTDLYNIFVYKRSDRSIYLAFIESEIELESRQYWQIENELIDKGFGKGILN